MQGNPPAGKGARFHPLKHSFQWRLLALSLVLLTLFFVITTLVLERAFRVSLHEQMQAHLESSLYTLLTAAEETAPGHLLLPMFLRDERLNQIDSGLYAYIANAQGKLLWRSASSIKHRMPPFPEAGLGDIAFSERRQERQRFLVARNDVLWESGQGRETRYRFMVLESMAAAEASVARFRRTAWVWLGMAALSLFVLMVVVLRWGMRPLRQVSRSLRDIEAGERELIEGEFPLEIRVLTDHINGFIASEREQRKRYIETMANLAHSLKTPLAVLHTVTEREANEQALRTQVQEQVQRMHDIVRYQLQRSVTKGRSPLTASVDIAPTIRQTVAALEKVYASRAIRFQLVCPERLRFAGEPGDFMEILGNLLDNAGKWASRQVRCHVSETTQGKHQRRLHIDVEDDGPGIPKTKRPRVLGRGERLDEQVEGQGIGLSVVAEIVAAYHGELKFGTSPELEGAWIHIDLPM